MSVDDSAPKPRQGRIGEMRGMRVWRVTVGDGNTLAIGFGTPDRTAVFESTIGSVWRWETAERMIIGSEDRREDVIAAVMDLIGKRLARFRADSPSQGVRLGFDDGSRLIIFPVTTDWWEHWSIEFPDEWVLTIGPGAEWGWDPPESEVVS